MAGLNVRHQKKVVDEVGSILPELNLTLCPPEAVRVINKILQDNIRKRDIYAPIKRKSNRMGLAIYNKLKKRVAHSKDRLLTAVEIAVIGNIIDYGAKNHLEVDRELERMLHEEHKTIRKENKRIFDYQAFRRQALRAKTILYLADNAGETVFDRVLIEEIQKTDKTKKIIYAVKEKPVINDALKEDAVFCGIAKTAEIISSGTDAPGTVLSLCSQEFLSIYNKANMIISKGQGNFEALSNSKRPVFFLFMIKCSVIAKHVRGEIGDIVLLNKKRGKR